MSVADSNATVEFEGKTVYLLEEPQRDKKPNGKACYISSGQDKQGNNYLINWEITNDRFIEEQPFDEEDMCDICDWDVYEIDKL